MPVQLDMACAQFGDWLELTMSLILLSMLKAFFVQCEELALVIFDRFLVFEYLTLSGLGAVSLLGPENASVSSSSVIRSSFVPASVRVLSGPFQTAFLSNNFF